MKIKSYIPTRLIEADRIEHVTGRPADARLLCLYRRAHGRDKKEEQTTQHQESNVFVLFLPQVHEVSAEDNEGNADNQEDDADGVQCWMKTGVEYPICGQYKTDRDRQDCNHKAGGSSQLPNTRFALNSFFTHKPNLRPAT